MSESFHAHSGPIDRVHLLEMIIEQQENDLVSLHQWKAEVQGEIEALRSRVSSLERLRRIAAKAWAKFWSDPVKYALAIGGLIAWLSGKISYEQWSKSIGGGGP